MNIKKSILVVGASGFIGRRLVSALASDWHDVIALARRTPAPAYPVNVEVITASLDNMTVLDALLARCAAVFHVASDSTPGTTAAQPALETSLNIVPTLRLLEALQKHPNVPLVYLSSGGAVYRPVDHGLLSEQAELLPASYYGAGKISIEKFIGAMACQYGGRALILRPSNVYGPGQHFRRGFGLIPTLFRHAVDGTVLTIWGDGEIVRDYLFIEDFLALCMKIVKSDFTFTGVQTYNAGSGSAYSINQVCSLVENISGRTLDRRYLPARSIDLRRIVLDSGKAKKVYGWQPVTPLALGISQSWNWFQHDAG